MDALFFLFTSPAFMLALLVCTAAAVAAVVARRRASTVGLTPLRLLLPWAGSLLLSPVGWLLPGGTALLGVMAAVDGTGRVWVIAHLLLVAVQLVLTVRLLLRHRNEWRLLLPLAVTVTAWIPVILMVDIAVAIGPMVK